MKAYYHTKKRCIVYIQKKADSDFWDRVWQDKGDWIKEITPKASKRTRTVSLITSFTKKTSKILEAGCGMGQYVYRLQKDGYQCSGVDYAKDTVEKLNKYYPNLDIREMDVFDLSGIKDGEYDCYYSGGIIEHFWDGYDGILKEADRVLSRDGVAIFVFPYMSKSRKLHKNKLNQLDSYDAPEGFYQFALDPKEFICKMKALGYRLIHKKRRNGLKGLIEVHPTFGFLSKLYNYKGHNRLVKLFRYILSDLLSLLDYGHTIEIVLKKR